jgi:ribosome biogenesis GTPase
VKGTVLRGSRNIFTLQGEDGLEYECSLKGKVLRGVEDAYNPLAPGDEAEFRVDSPGKGVILGLEARRNRFTRFNQKAVQVLAANVGLVICVTSPASPPFRPRFIDRVLLQAEVDGIPAAVLLNKQDLGSSGVEERLLDYSRIGYEVLRVSARTGEGIDGLRSRLKGRRAVFTGQSGVGKSSLINAIAGAPIQRIGGLNEKYDRGNHITVMARLFSLGDGIEVVDSPGVRRLAVNGIEAGELAGKLPEFAALAGACRHGASCSHTCEPGCRILEALHEGAIHEDRYRTYLNVREELLQRS